MNRNYLIVMDDIKSINYHKDTSLAMMWAIKARGHSLYYCNIDDLSLLDGVVFVRTRSLDVFEDSAHFYELGDVFNTPATFFDVVLMRKDPPFDMNFLYATYLLETAKKAGVLVINDPKSIRDCNEKLFATAFSHLMAPTLVSANADQIRNFVASEEDVIVKPLDGMGGMGIFRLTQGGQNIGAVLETLTQNGTLPIMAQRYLPQIVEGDKRILIVGGQVVPYALARIPQAGETRGNLAAGGRGVAMALTQKERAIAQEVAPVLLDKGLWFVGLDVIGNRITEINVTSPTCVRQIDAAFGTSIAQDFIDYIDAHLSAVKP